MRFILYSSAWFADMTSYGYIRNSLYRISIEFWYLTSIFIFIPSLYIKDDRNRKTMRNTDRYYRKIQLGLDC